MISQTEIKTIAELDLDPIKVKLMHKESGEGWSLEKANAVELEYRRFLQLMKMFPNEQTAPLFDVDTFWHYHILDTLKYAADCENVFGYFLHHFPYIGLRGEDDEVEHQLAGNRMQELYEATFGEAYIRETPATKAEGKLLWSEQGSAAGKDKLAAWSGAASPASMSKLAAWSGAASPGKDKLAAWSGAASPGKDKLAAWSGAATKVWSGAADKAPDPDFYTRRPALPEMEAA